MNAARVKAQPVGPGFAPYVWAPGVDEVAVRQGVPRRSRPQVRPEHAAAPGRASGAARRQHGAARGVSRRDVSGAPGGGGLLRRALTGERRRGSGGGRPDPAGGPDVPRSRGLRGNRAADLCALPDRDHAPRRRGRRPGRRRRSALDLQPQQPDGHLGRAGGDRRARAEPGGRDRRGGRGLRRIRGPFLRALGGRAGEPRRPADPVEGVRLRCAPRRVRARAPGDGRRSSRSAARRLRSPVRRP